MEEYIKHLEALINPTNIEGDVEPTMFDVVLKKYLGIENGESTPSNGMITIGRADPEKAIPELQEFISRNIKLNTTAEDIKETLKTQLEAIKATKLDNISLDLFLSNRAESYKNYQSNPDHYNTLDQVVGMLQQATNSFMGDSELTSEVTEKELSIITGALDEMGVKHTESENALSVTIKGNYYSFPIQRQKPGRN